MHFTVPISHRLNKMIRSLQHKKFRDQNSLFIAEGEKICRELLKSEFVPELVVIRDYPSAESVSLAEAFADQGIAVYSAPKNQFDQMSTTRSPEGILAVVNKKESTLLTGEPFVALDSVTDPGNIGTIIRTAEWFGINQVILGRDCADKYNPKVVRSSMGSVFRSSIISYHDLHEFLTDNYSGYQIFGAVLDSKNELKKLKHNKKYGIIFGSESHGISPDLMDLVNKDFTIEGFGKAESLNVAMAVGISLYHFANN